MAQKTFSNGIRIEEVEDGPLVQQFGKPYVARNWRITRPVEQTIETALSSGLT